MSKKNIQAKNISGLILAGGEGRRMSGQDKGLIRIADKPLIEYAINCMAPLVDDLVISCNRNQDLYARYQLACIADQEAHTDSGYSGPMAGLVAGLKQAKHDWVLVMPCDTPLMTQNVMAQLVTGINQCNKIDSQAMVFFHNGLQPLHGIYHKSMLPVFERSLAENKNALHRLLRSLESVTTLAADCLEHSFNNANDIDELKTIEKFLSH